MLSQPRRGRWRWRRSSAHQRMRVSVGSYVIDAVDGRCIGRRNLCWCSVSGEAAAEIEVVDAWFCCGLSPPAKAEHMVGRRINIVPRITRLKLTAWPERTRASGISRMRLTIDYLSIYRVECSTSPVLIHHDQNTVNLILSSGVKNQMHIYVICGVITVGDPI